MPVHFWTRRCRGTCGDTEFHTHDLSWFGKIALWEKP